MANNEPNNEPKEQQKPESPKSQTNPAKANSDLSEFDMEQKIEPVVYEKVPQSPERSVLSVLNKEPQKVRSFHSPTRIILSREIKSSKES